MKSVKQLMQELGFNEGADEKVAKAFLNNLNKAINHNQRPAVIKPKQDFRPKKVESEQLSFDFSNDSHVKKSS